MEYSWLVTKPDQPVAWAFFGRFESETQALAVRDALNALAVDGLRAPPSGPDEEACELLRGWLIESTDLDDPDGALHEVEAATTAFLKRQAGAVPSPEGEPPKERI